MTANNKIFKSKLKIAKGMPDLTPLIDVVFLLLLFFMLSSSFIQLTGIKINLPEVVASENSGAEKLVIAVDKNGNCFFNDERLDWTGLKLKLREYAERWRVDTVILVADKEAEYGEIIKLMSLARSLNLNVYAATATKMEKNDDGDFKTHY
jgi:biopolymer transport protein ExbD